MRVNRSKLPKGMTLLEIMLVTTIGAALLVGSFKMYQSMEIENNLEQVQYNVDVLFQSLAGYYHANCYGQGDITSTGAPTSPGTLNPKVSPAPVSPKPIDIIGDLVNPGYLAKWPLVNVPLLDNTNVAETYVVQFNEAPPITPIQVNACVILDPSKPCVSQLSTVAALNNLPSAAPNISQTIVWKAQVAVKLADPDAAAAFAGRLSADCTSDLSGSTVSPCSAGTPGPYLVWERLPSFASPETRSSFWISMPLLKQFNLQYTHDQMYELQNSNAGTQNYLCGG